MMGGSTIVVHNHVIYDKVRISKIHIVYIVPSLSRIHQPSILVV